MYDFKTNVNRGLQGSAKWRLMQDDNPNLAADIVPFSVADSDLLMAPEIVEGLQEYLKTMVLGYTIATQSYYDAVLSWFKRRHNWDVKQEWLVESPGVVSALYNVIAAFTDVDDGVIIMSPVYYPFRLSIENQKRRVIENALINTGRSYLIDFEDLEAKARDPKTKVLILCSPHNPVGRVWTLEELERVSEICERHNILVLSDEIHFDLVLPGNKHTVYATVSVAASNHSIIATAPSKSFNLAGLQTSNLVIKNPQFREIFADYMGKTGFHALNAIGPKACEIAYNDCESWLDEFVRLIDTNYHVFKNFIEAYIPEIKVFPLEGTYLLWFDCSGLGMTDEALNRFIKDTCHLYLDAGNMFGPLGKQFQRINISCPTAVLESALERLLKNVKETRK